MINDAKLRALKPQDKVYRVAVDEGLSLEVRPTGKKFWRCRFRVDGKATMISLGEFPIVSLKEARRLLDDRQGHIKRGVHPLDHDRKKAAQEAALAADTLEVLMLEWLGVKAKIWTPGVTVERRAMLNNYVLPVLGGRAIRSIGPPEIYDLVMGIAETKKPTAKLVHQMLNEIFQYGQVKERCGENPCLPVKGVAAGHKVRNSTPLSPENIRLLFERIEADGRLTPGARLANEMLFLTTVRTSELLNATWDEFDRDAGIWTIPADRMKMRRPHVVPLLPRVVEILGTLELLCRGSKFILPGRDKAKPLSGEVLYKGWTKRIDGHSPHDARATFSSWAYESGRYDSMAIELQLAHADRNTIRQVYNHAIMLDTRRKMLADFESYLLAARSSGSVVPFRRVG